MTILKREKQDDIRVFSHAYLLLLSVMHHNPLNAPAVSQRISTKSKSKYIPTFCALNKNLLFYINYKWLRVATSHLQFFALPQDRKTMARNPLMPYNARVITPLEL